MTIPSDIGPPGVARAGVSVGAGKLAAGLLSFAALVLASRLLAPADYGVLVLVLVSSSVLYAVLASWSSLPVYVLAAEELRDHGTMAGTSAARLSLTVGVSVLVAVVVALAAAGGLLDAIEPLWILAWVAAGLGHTVCEHVTSLLETRGTYVGSVAVQVARPAAWAVGLLGVLVAANPSLDAVLWVLVGSWVGAAGLAVVLAGRMPLRPIRISRRRAAVLLAAAAPLIAYSVGQLLLGSVDLYVLRAFATADDVGVYGLAYQCFSMGALLSSAVVVVITPRLAGDRDSPAAVRAYLAGLEQRGLPLLAAAVTLLLPWVVPVTTVLFGDAYHRAGPPLVVLGLAFLALAATTAQAPVLLVQRRFRLMAVGALGAVVVNLGLDLVLVGVLGLGVVAPAAATSVALTLTWLLYQQQLGQGTMSRTLVGVVAVGGITAASAVASLLLPLAVAAALGAALAAGQLLLARWTGGIPRSARSAHRRAARATQAPDDRP